MSNNYENLVKCEDCKYARYLYKDSFGDRYQCTHPINKENRESIILFKTTKCTNGVDKNE